MSILDKALETVNSTRQSEYGDPVENAVREALIMAGMGVPLTPEMIVKTHLAQKIVRVGRGDKEDTTIDVAGYADILQRVRDRMNDGSVQRYVERLLGGWVEFEQKNPFRGVDFKFGFGYPPTEGE